MSTPHQGSEPSAASPDGPDGAATGPRWTLSDVVAGWLVAQVAATIGAGILLGSTYGGGEAMVDLSSEVLGTDLAVPAAALWRIAVVQAFLWIGLAGAPLLAARRTGSSLVDDLGLWARGSDLPLGLLLGAASQLLLVPAVSWPWVRLLGAEGDDLSAPARALTDRATDPVGVALLVLITVIGAPVIEELFFRGLLQRWVRARFGVVLAVAISSITFGITHFQLLQLPALIAFGVVLGVLAARTGRLGPGIATHLGFNLVTVVLLLLG